MESKKGKLLLLCQHFYPEMISSGILMTELCVELAARGWDITVCCAQPSLSLERKNETVPRSMGYKGIQIRRCRSWGSHDKGIFHRLVFALSYLLFAAWTSLRRASDFDAILVTTNPPFIGLPGLICRMRTGRPYVQIVHDVYPDITIKLGVLKEKSPIAEMWGRLSSATFRGADANIVLGRDMAEVIKSKIGTRNGAGRVTCIPNWSNEKNVYPIPGDRNNFRAEHNPNGLFTVQYAGRMSRTHNLEPLVDAAERLAQRGVLFQFIGDGAKKRPLMERVAEKGLTNVQFLPYQPMEKLGEMISAADLSVVCLESFYTGLSVPCKSYGLMAGGRPILGFLDPKGEIAGMICENECGVVLSDPDGEQVSNVISELMNDPDKLGRMGMNGYEAFRSKYTLSLAVDRYEAVIRKVLSEVSKRHPANLELRVSL